MKTTNDCPNPGQGRCYPGSQFLKDQIATNTGLAQEANWNDVNALVSTMADQTSQLKQITQETSEEMAKLVDNLAPVAVMPEFKQSLENMNDQVDLLTNTLCASPLFAAQCPADLRGALG